MKVETKERIIKHGEIYWVDFSKEAFKSEVYKFRPALIISNNSYNRMSSRVLIIPLSTNYKNPYPWEVLLYFNKKKSKIMCDQIRAVDKERLNKKFGYLSDEILFKVNEVIKNLTTESYRFSFSI